MKIGMGVVTFNRPEFAEKCIKAIRKHLTDSVDALFLYNDGSLAKHAGAYKRVYRVVDEIGTVIDTVDNRGVAYSKNMLLDAMLDAECDILFLVEDDMIAQSSEAVNGYIAASAASGIHHLSFSHHGPANLNVPDGDGPVSFFPHSIGAWGFYTRECIEAVGPFDERMINAFEHVNHDMRLIRAGFMPGAAAHKFPDATGSTSFVAEIPGSIDKSSIRPRPDWQSSIRSSAKHWATTDPETWDMLFGDGMPLHDYAMGILGE